MLVFVHVQDGLYYGIQHSTVKPGDLDRVVG